VAVIGRNVFPVAHLSGVEELEQLFLGINEIAAGSWEFATVFGIKSQSLPQIRVIAAHHEASGGPKVAHDLLNRAALHQTKTRAPHIRQKRYPKTEMPESAKGVSYRSHHKSSFL
jgi:hypothetical protein